MSNMAGLVVIAVGVFLGIIAIRGTQKQTFGNLFNSTVLPSSSSSSAPMGNPTLPNGQCPPGQLKLPDGSCSSTQGV